MFELGTFSVNAGLVVKMSEIYDCSAFEGKRCVNGFVSLASKEGHYKLISTFLCWPQSLNGEAELMMMMMSG